MSSSTLPTATADRPASIRSVASNSSTASGVNLSRRPRTRARSKTLTGGSVGRGEDPPQSPMSELPYLDKPVVQEPLPAKNSKQAQSPACESAQQSTGSDSHATDTPNAETSEHGTAEATFVEIPPISPMSAKMTKAAKQASGLSVLETNYKPPPSAFSRDPQLTPVTNVRDSVSTQQSGTSSSLYPPSTSTASGVESPTSPRSMDGQPDQYEITSFSPEVEGLEEYDNDDVAYRLRLLVKNNYFLPPAHSKPSPSDLAASALNASKKQTRAGTPTFLDLFRVGKTKPKNSAGAIEVTGPMLRTTSDSITVLRSQPRPSLQGSRISPHPPGNTPRGRVVVVREKMNDLMIAAKQAEQDLKARGTRPDQGSQNARQELFNDVIDPTDAVDLPPPSSTYPFAVQASALHGLGVAESVGAAVLADRLPPKSPNMSSYDTDDDWRKALLHEAVHHSLDTSPDLSSFSHAAGASTPLTSPRIRALEPSSQVLPSNPKATILQQRILDPPLLEFVTSSTSHSRKKSTASHASASKLDHLATPASHLTQGSSRPSSFLPLRVDTPTGPMTPLTPPPRRHIIPTYSHSQNDLPRESTRQSSDAAHSSSSPPPNLRRTMSSPLLSEGYDSSMQGMMITPPPVPTLTVYSRTSSQVSSSSFLTNPEAPSVTTSDSHYSDDESDAGVPRASLSLSVVNDRPSMSEYSLSPTTSAFQDLLNRDGYHSTASSIHQLSHFSAEQHSSPRDSRDSRYSTMSPPPRMSSSLAHFALSPPPRYGSHPYASGLLRNSSSSLSERDRCLTPTVEDPTVHFVAPEPTTPPLPTSEGNATSNSGHSRSPLSLDIPSSSIPASIHSAPGPLSSTSFFDTIQTQPNAMDDLESSSDEEDEPIHEGPSPRSPAIFIDPRVRAISSVSSPSSRPPIMRLGNHSTPYIGKSNLPIGIHANDRKRPIANIPVRTPFFAERKSEQGHGIPSSALDFYKYTQEHPPISAAGPSVTQRPSTSEHINRWNNNQRAQESLRKLDGMLIQHMESEKDTIKRIATTLKHMNPQQPSDTIP